MNWLAHVLLSPNGNNDFLMGNLLTDVLSPDELKGHGLEFSRGVECHYAIDRFTDAHSCFKKSKAILYPSYRHYSSVIVDMFYDHFLAVNWHLYCRDSYRDFVENFYDIINSQGLDLSAKALDFIEAITKSQRLATYGTVRGIETALKYISRRSSGRVDIVKSVVELEENYGEFEKHFLEFFPLLEKEIEIWLKGN